jgi:O-antigen/teichoic acid export membrane protein
MRDHANGIEVTLKKISSNILYSFLGEILLFFFSFIFGVLTARYLGAAGKGSFWIIYNVSGLLSLIFSMRFCRSLTYHLSKNKDLLGEIILYGLFVGIVTIFCIAFVEIYFSGILYKSLLKDITTSCPIILLICFSVYLWTLIIALMEGLMLFNVKAIFMGGVYFLKCILVFSGLAILNLKFNDLILFMGSVETFVYALIIIMFLGKAKHFNVKTSSFKEMLKYSAKSFPGMVSDLITLRIDAFIVNYFSGLAEVGIYSVAVSFASMLLYLPMAIRNVLLPYIARYSDGEVTAKLSRLLIIVMCFLSLIIIPAIWVAVVPIYGKAFSYSRVLFLILLPGTIFWGIFCLLASDLEGRGLPWQVSVVSMVSALISIALCLILIPIWNSTGAAVVSSITYGLSMILAANIYGRRTGVNMSQFLIPKAEDFQWLIKVNSNYIFKFWAILSPVFTSKSHRTG